jgi:hypothetical protein
MSVNDPYYLSTDAFDVQRRAREEFIGRKVCWNDEVKGEIIEVDLCPKSGLLFTAVAYDGYGNISKDNWVTGNSGIFGWAND